MMLTLSLVALLSFTFACSSADPSLEETASSVVDPNDPASDPGVQVSDLDAAGELYILSKADGMVRAITGASVVAPARN